MPAKYKLRYLTVAQDDLISIFDYIAKDIPERALTFIGKLDKKIDMLERQPLLGRVPRHQKLKQYGYRVLIIESYLVFYVVRNEVVEVHRVIHGSRNLDYLI